MITYAPRDDHKAIQARRQRLAKEQSKRKTRFLYLLIVLAVVIAVGVSGYGLYVKKLPVVSAKTTTIATKAEKIELAWPTEGRAAIGASVSGVLSASADQSPAPTASVAKVMTSVMVLKKHPLKAGEQGPSLTISQKDVDSYNNYAAQDGSTVPVEVGETLTEYQALQAVMLPSANNMADTLAVWAYGSLEKYHQAANEYARNIGMTQTTIAGDASGFSSATTSTPKDLVLLGQVALKEPALKEISAQQTADIPVAGKIENVNSLLGTNGVVGLKTGNTFEAGGCFLFAAETKIDSRLVTVVGVIMKSPTLDQAMADSQPLIDSAFAGFGSTVIAKQGTTIGAYSTAWGTKTNAVTARDLSVFGWKGTQAAIAIHTPNLILTSEKPYFGTITASTSMDKQTVPLVLDNKLYGPSVKWRLGHLL